MLWRLWQSRAPPTILCVTFSTQMAVASGLESASELFVKSTCCSGRSTLWSFPQIFERGICQRTEPTCVSSDVYYNMYWNTEDLLANFIPSQSTPLSWKTPEMNRSRWVDSSRYFYYFLTPNSREDIIFWKFSKNVHFFSTKNLTFGEAR